MRWYNTLVHKDNPDVLPLPPRLAEDHAAAHRASTDWEIRNGSTQYRKLTLLDVDSPAGSGGLSEEIEYLIGHVPLFAAVYEMGMRAGHRHAVEEFRNDA